MAKRSAHAQITRETFGSESDDQDTASGSGDGFKKASSDVMRTRKIAQPRKRKQQVGAGFGASSESSMAGAFTGSKNGGNGSIKAAGAEKNLGAHRKALNLQFQAKISQFISADPCADLSSVFDQYKRYISDMESAGSPASTAAVAQPNHSTTEKSASETKPEAEEDSDSDEEVKIQGPSFTLTQKPTTSNPVFSFGAKKRAARDSSDSESEVEIKGPQFTFQASEAASNPSANVFKLKADSSSKPEPQAPAATADITPAQPGAAGKPAFNSSVASSTKPSFNFGQSKEKKEEAPKEKPAFSFAFGATKSEEAKPKPAFSFGKPAETEKSEGAKPKPAFSFGKPAETEKSATFAFGKTAQDSSAPSTSTATAVTSADDDQQKASAKPFSFGGTSFSNQKNNTSGPPSFSFGKTAQEPAENTTAKSAFKFGTPGSSDATTEEQKTDSAEKPKPSFTFGASSSSTAPNFSFGKSAESKPTDSKQESKPAPSGGFKFSLPFSSGSQPPTENKDVAQPKEASEETGAQDTKPASEEGRSMVMSNGEEGEDLLFSKRAKLMVINPETKGYDSRGVGELKVLQNKDDKKKVRILCRSDGMGHILLNTSVVKSFQYVPADADKENFVKCPVVNGDGKLENYIIRVKQKADGRQLCQALSDAQASMS